MSRRTPIKDLIAEESATPSSPIRRSTRIAVRRSSITDENHDLDRLSVSSASSQRSVNTRSRAASKSPLSLLNDEEQKNPSMRTRRRGSTSSLIEDELESVNRSSPFPARLSKRNLVRSMSCSPIAEMENKVAKTSTPTKSKRSRIPSLTEPVVVLESIKEVESKSPAKHGTSTDEPRDEDLPFKKKKAVLMQTIIEKPAEDLEAPVKSNGDVHLEEIDNESTENKSKQVELNENVHESSISKKSDISVLDEEKELVILLHDISDSVDSKKNVALSDPQKKSTTDDVANINLHLSDSGEETTKEIDDTSNKENSEDGHIENQKSTISNDTETHKAEISFDEPMDVDVTIDTDTLTPKKPQRKSLISDSNNTIQESEESQKEHEVPVILENNSLNSSDSNTRIDDEGEDETSPSSGGNSLNHCGKNSLIRESITEINQEDDPKKAAVEEPSKADCESIVSSPEKSLPSSLDEKKMKDENIESFPEKSLPLLSTRDTSIDEDINKNEDVLPPSGNILKEDCITKDTESPKKSTATKSVSSPQKVLAEANSQEAKCVSPHNITSIGSVLVATNATPLRRSPRLHTHSSSKDRPDITSSPVHKKQDGTISPKKSNDKVSENKVSVTDNSKNSSVDSLKDQKSNLPNKEENLHNKTFNSSIDIELDPVLKEKIANLTETLEIDSSSSSDAESVTHYIDDMAEEGEEDTPSEGSNDIIELGESVGSVASEIDSEESYEVDSFIDDNEDEIELLSGEEYDLTQEKPKKRKHLKRILQIQDSSDEEEKKEKDQVNHIGGNETETVKSKDDSDIENMSTRPYCGLSPPIIISVRDSPECDDRLENNKSEEESSVTTLINKEDNLESLEEIKEQNREPVSSEVAECTETKSPEKPNVKDVNSIRTPNTQSEPSSHTPSNNILDGDRSLTETKKHSKSVNIQESVSLREVADGSVSDRILKVVELFCLAVNQSSDKGNISLNLSLDYVDSATPPHENDDNETVGRKRVLSESGVDFYLAKKRLSRGHREENELITSSPLCNKRKSDDQYFVEQKKDDTIQSPTNVIKMLSHTTVDDVPVRRNMKKQKQDSLTESSKETSHLNKTFEFQSPEKLKRKKNTSQITNEGENERIDVLNPAPEKITPKKGKEKRFTDSTNLIKDRDDPIHSSSMISGTMEWDITDEDEPVPKQKNITHKKQKQNTFSESIDKPTHIKSSKMGRQKFLSTSANDENNEIIHSTKLPKVLAEENEQHDSSVLSKKGTSKKQKREKLIKSEEIHKPLVIQPQSKKVEKAKTVETIESDEVLSFATKKAKKSKRMLAVSTNVVQGDAEMPTKKKSKKNTSEAYSAHIEVLQQTSERDKERKKKKNVDNVSNDIPLKKAKDSRKLKHKPSSDSEMSDDLDKQIHGKYSNLNEDKEHVKSKKKNKNNPGVSNVNEEKQTSSNDSDWQVEYLPHQVKLALLKSVKSIEKHTTEVVMGNRKPKLLPSSKNPLDGWQLDELNLSAKPTSNKIVPVVTEFHAKDFKSRATFDSKRVKRMETKELLKKKMKL